MGSASDPLIRILILLTLTVGGPYALLSSTAPLLQRWFTLGESKKSPWRLYALSNFGSFLALLSYPFAIEPFLRLRTQGWIWSAAYVLFAAACVFAAWRVRATPSPEALAGGEVNPAARPGVVTVLFWLGLSACGSIVLVATTNQISEDIAVSPFLWVAALAIYLLTFVLAFESSRFYRRTLFAIAAGIAAPVACMLQAASIGLSLRLQLALYLLAEFVICMLCNGELARSRPSPRYLTAFYLTIAAGGALGGAFVALLAPRVFTEFSEYPIGLAGACLAGFLGWLRTGALSQWTSRNLAVRLPLMALLIGGLTAIVATATGGKQGAVASVRNFYGILRVKERTDAYATEWNTSRPRNATGRRPTMGRIAALRLRSTPSTNREGASPWLASARAHWRLGAVLAIRSAFTISIRMWSRSRAPGFGSCGIPKLGSRWFSATRACSSGANSPRDNRKIST
jgi:hypothetical protein